MRYHIFALVSGLLGMVAVSTTQETGIPKAPSPLANPPAIVFVQAPVLAAGELAARFPQGSRLVRLASGNKLAPVVNLTPEFFAVADPQVSFDGATILFAAEKEPGAPWQIWEMNADGSQKRRITQHPENCLRPAYLPHNEIVFTVTHGSGRQATSQLYVSKLDGSDAHPITFGPGNFQVETVLRNGLILVSAASPLLSGPQAERSRELYTLRTDGTSLALFRRDPPARVLRSQAAELEDGSVVFVKTSPADGRVGGELAQVRRGALHNGAISPMGAAYWSPRFLDAEKLLVARRVPAAPHSKEKFDLYALDSASGKVGERIYQDARLSSVQAVPLAARATPKWYWSTLNFDLKVGYLICLDSYRAANVPGGRLKTFVAKVRVLTLDPATGQESSLGEAPVEPDGSFYVSLPPDRPLRLELLDREGKLTRAQRSWIWTRPGEERGCVGCHEDPSLAPENRWPLALRRFDTPFPLGVEAVTKAAH